MCSKYFFGVSETIFMKFYGMLRKYTEDMNTNIFGQDRTNGEGGFKHLLYVKNEVLFKLLNFFVFDSKWFKFFPNIEEH